ncbi:uncharacterized protein C01G6.5-like [Lytechinus variegatus]|uniref:uncharacterized protein C01G6.5-like n=1 Tax=Lytechinus variegatus TaxID=7654 RepID=UPI001BB1BAB0|nr:uncharacterized protein C01G6.5-like [Lytechinus variegatus]
MTEIAKLEKPADEDTGTASHVSAQPPGTGTPGPSLLYQLRRVGAAASMQGVKDVFKLTKPRTIIGRNTSEVDCFVDSSVHTRLISRQHVEILMEMDENQSPILYVLDKSLNGTFVNDIKISSQTKVPLKEGDTLTLGHLRGVQVKQGTFAEQETSEFRFRLVYAPVEEDCTEDGENTPTKRRRKDSPKVSKKTRILHPPDSNVTSPTSQTANRAASIPPPFLQNSIHEDDSESGAKMAGEKGKTRVDSTPASFLQDSENETLKEEENTQTSTKPDSSRGRLKRGRGRAAVIGAARGRASTLSGRGRGSSRGLGRGRGRGRGQGDSSRKTEGAPVSGKDARQGASTSKGAEDTFEFELESDSGGEENSNLHRQLDSICKSLDTSDSDSVKSKAGSSRSSRGRPPKNAASSKSEPKHTDKKKGESATATQGVRKKRAAAPKNDDDDVEYNSQPCSAAKCYRPKDRTVTWVQCDDCDNWFHVTCAGCDYNKVKQADYQFFCGCKPKKLKK